MKTEKLLKKFVETALEGKYQDAEIPTLQLWVGKQSKVWYFIKKHKFKQFRTAIGPYPTITREMAVDQCNIYLSNLIRFNRLDPEPETPASEFTIGDANQYYMQQKGIDPNEHRRKTVWKHLQSFLNRPIASVSHDEIVAHHRKVSEHAPVTANNMIRLLRATINFAIRNGKYSGNNPASKVTLNRENPRQRYLMPSEAPKVIKYLYEMRKEGNKQRNAADALLLMLFTWQRKSNVLSMRWPEIDETGTWTIPAQKAKARKDIVVPLSREALAILNERKDNGSEYVFPNDRNPAGYIADIKNSWKRVQTACGIKDVHIHDLRHTGATYALRSGADITTVSATLAHASVSFTAKVYAHVMLESKKEAARGAIDAMMGKKK